MQTAITTKGQATIPKQIRLHFKLKAGDKVKWFIHPHGHIVAFPMRPLSDLRGIVKSAKPRRALPPEVDEAIAEGATERYEIYLKQR